MIVNSYGLFASMTTRDKIQIQASMDGKFGKITGGIQANSVNNHYGGSPHQPR